MWGNLKALFAGARARGRTIAIALGTVVLLAIGLTLLRNTGIHPLAIFSATDSSWGGSPWSYSEKIDPMTDKPSSMATARFAGEHFDVEVEAACYENGGIVYQFTALDSDDQPVPLRVDQLIYGGVPVDNHLSFLIRPDDLPAWDLVNPRPTYNNQVTLHYRTLLYFDKGRRNPAFEVANAKRVKLQLFSNDGDQIFEWSQDFPEFAKAMRPCVNTALTPIGLVPNQQIAQPSSSNASIGTEALSSAPPAQFTPAQRKLIDEVSELEEQCRGGYFDTEAAQQKVCEERDQATHRMIRGGVCWGKESDQSEADYKYHVCAPGSIGYSDSPQARGQ